MSEEILSWDEQKEIDILKVITPGDIFYLEAFIQKSNIRVKYRGSYSSHDGELYLCFEGGNYVKSIKHSSIKCTYWHRTVECEDVVCYALGIHHNITVREFDPVAIKLFDIGFHRLITDYLEVQS